MALSTADKQLISQAWASGQLNDSNWGMFLERLRNEPDKTQAVQRALNPDLWGKFRRNYTRQKELLTDPARMWNLAGEFFDEHGGIIGGTGEILKQTVTSIPSVIGAAGTTLSGKAGEGEYPIDTIVQGVQVWPYIQSGITAGAAIGSVLPGKGTAIGAGVGALVGVGAAGVMKAVGGILGRGLTRAATSPPARWVARGADVADIVASENPLIEAYGEGVFEVGSTGTAVGVNRAKRQRAERYVAEWRDEKGYQEVHPQKIAPVKGKADRMPGRRVRAYQGLNQAGVPFTATVSRTTTGNRNWQVEIAVEGLDPRTYDFAKARDVVGFETALLAGMTRFDAENMQATAQAQADVAQGVAEPPVVGPETEIVDDVGVEAEIQEAQQRAQAAQQPASTGSPIADRAVADPQQFATAVWDGLRIRLESGDIAADAYPSERDRVLATIQPYLPADVYAAIVETMDTLHADWSTPHPAADTQTTTDAETPVADTPTPAETPTETPAADTDTPAETQTPTSQPPAPSTPPTTKRGELAVADPGKFAVTEWSEIFEKFDEILKKGGTVDESMYIAERDRRLKTVRPFLSESGYGRIVETMDRLYQEWKSGTSWSQELRSQLTSIDIDSMATLGAGSDAEGRAMRVALSELDLAGTPEGDTRETRGKVMEWIRAQVAVRRRQIGLADLHTATAQQFLANPHYAWQAVEHQLTTDGVLPLTAAPTAEQEAAFVAAMDGLLGPLKGALNQLEPGGFDRVAGEVMRQWKETTTAVAEGERDADPEAVETPEETTDVETDDTDEGGGTSPADSGTPPRVEGDGSPSGTGDVEGAGEEGIGTPADAAPVDTGAQPPTPRWEYSRAYHFLVGRIAERVNNDPNLIEASAQQLRSQIAALPEYPTTDAEAQRFVQELIADATQSAQEVRARAPLVETPAEAPAETVETPSDVTGAPEGDAVLDEAITTEDGTVVTAGEIAEQLQSDLESEYAGNPFFANAGIDSTSDLSAIAKVLAFLRGLDRRIRGNIGYHHPSAPREWYQVNDNTFEMRMTENGHPIPSLPNGPFMTTATITIGDKQATVSVPMANIENVVVELPPRGELSPKSQLVNPILLRLDAYLNADIYAERRLLNRRRRAASPSPTDGQPPDTPPDTEATPDTQPTPEPRTGVTETEPTPAEQAWVADYVDLLKDAKRQAGGVAYSDAQLAELTRNLLAFRERLRNMDATSRAQLARPSFWTQQGRRGVWRSGITNSGSGPYTLSVHKSGMGRLSGPMGFWIDLWVGFIPKAVRDAMGTRNPKNNTERFENGLEAIGMMAEDLPDATPEAAPSAQAATRTEDAEAGVDPDAQSPTPPQGPSDAYQLLVNTIASLVDPNDLNSVGAAVQRARAQIEALPEYPTINADAQRFVRKLIADVTAQVKARAPLVGTPTDTETSAETPAAAREGVVYRADNETPLRTRYEVWELGDIIPSHHIRPGNIKRSDYTAHQPREDRASDAALAKLDDDAQKLIPGRLLNRTDSMLYGAPLLSRKHPGNVLSGNGRIMMLLMAFERYPERWNAYEQALREAVAQYGIDVSEVTTKQQPVLVQVLDQEVDEGIIADEANDPDMMERSNIGEAAKYARYIDDNLMALWKMSGEDFNKAVMQDQQKDWRDRLLLRMTPNERNQFLDDDGKFTSAGLRILEHALIYYTFAGDIDVNTPEGQLGSAAVKTLVTDDSAGIANVKKAVRLAIPELAQSESYTRSSTDPDIQKLSIGLDLSKAILRLAESVEKKQDVRLLLDQQTLSFPGEERLAIDDLSPVALELFVLLSDMRKSERQAGTMLQQYAQAVAKAQKTSGQTGFLEVDERKVLSAEGFFAEELRQRAADAEQVLYQIERATDTVTLTDVGPPLGTELPPVRSKRRRILDWAKRVGGGFLGKPQTKRERNQARQYDNEVREIIEETTDDRVRARTLGIYANLKAGKPFNIIGHRITSPEEAAVIMQTYRSPFIEKAWGLYLNRRGEVLDYTGWTMNRMQKVSISQRKIASEMERLGAANFILLHNHPSARARFSDADKAATEQLRQMFGEQFLGSVIIDSGTYAEMMYGSPNDPSAHPVIRENQNLDAVIGEDMSTIRPVIGYSPFESPSAMREDIQLDPEKVGWDTTAEPLPTGIKPDDPLYKGAQPRQVTAFQETLPWGGHLTDEWDSMTDEELFGKGSTTRARYLGNLAVLRLGRLLKMRKNSITLLMTNTQGQIVAAREYMNLHTLAGPSPVHVDRVKGPEYATDWEASDLREFIYQEMEKWGGAYVHVLVEEGDWYKTRTDAAEKLRQLTAFEVAIEEEHPRSPSWTSSHNLNRGVDRLGYPFWPVYARKGLGDFKKRTVSGGGDVGYAPGILSVWIRGRSMLSLKVGQVHEGKPAFASVDDDFGPEDRTGEAIERQIYPRLPTELATTDQIAERDTDDTLVLRDVVRDVKRVVPEAAVTLPSEAVSLEGGGKRGSGRGVRDRVAEKVMRTVTNQAPVIAKKLGAWIPRIRQQWLAGRSEWFSAISELERMGEPGQELLDRLGKMTRLQHRLQNESRRAFFGTKEMPGPVKLLNQWTREQYKAYTEAGGEEGFEAYRLAIEEDIWRHIGAEPAKDPIVPYNQAEFAELAKLWKEMWREENRRDTHLIVDLQKKLEAMGEELSVVNRKGERKPWYPISSEFEWDTERKQFYVEEEGVRQYFTIDQAFDQMNALWMPHYYSRGHWENEVRRMDRLREQLDALPPDSTDIPGFRYIAEGAERRGPGWQWMLGAKGTSRPFFTDRGKAIQHARGRIPVLRNRAKDELAALLQGVPREGHLERERETNDQRYLRNLGLLYDTQMRVAQRIGEISFFGQYNPTFGEFGGAPFLRQYIERIRGYAADEQEHALREFTRPLLSYDNFAELLEFAPDEPEAAFNAIRRWLQELRAAKGQEQPIDPNRVFADNPAITEAMKATLERIGLIRRGEDGAWRMRSNTNIVNLLGDYFGTVAIRENTAIRMFQGLNTKEDVDPVELQGHKYWKAINDATTIGTLGPTATIQNLTEIPIVLAMTGVKAAMNALKRFASDPDVREMGEWMGTALGQSREYLGEGGHYASKYLDFIRFSLTDRLGRAFGTVAGAERTMEDIRNYMEDPSEIHAARLRELNVDLKVLEEFRAMGGSAERLNVIFNEFNARYARGLIPVEGVRLREGPAADDPWTDIIGDEIGRGAAYISDSSYKQYNRLSLNSLLASRDPKLRVFLKYQAWAFQQSAHVYRLVKRAFRAAKRGDFRATFWLVQAAGSLMGGYAGMRYVYDILQGKGAEDKEWQDRAIDAFAEGQVAGYLSVIAEIYRRSEGNAWKSMNNFMFQLSPPLGTVAFRPIAEGMEGFSGGYTEGGVAGGIVGGAGSAAGSIVRSAPGVREARRFAGFVLPESWR